MRRDVTRTPFGHRFALATATDSTHETFTKRLLFGRYPTVLNVTFNTPVIEMTTTTAKFARCTTTRYHPC